MIKETFLGTSKGHSFKPGGRHGYSEDEEGATVHEVCERCGLEFIDVAYRNHDSDRETIGWIPSESYLILPGGERRALPANSLRKVNTDAFLASLPRCTATLVVH